MLLLLLPLSVFTAVVVVIAAAVVIVAIAPVLAVLVCPYSCSLRHC